MEKTGKIADTQRFIRLLTKFQQLLLVGLIAIRDCFRQSIDIISRSKMRRFPLFLIR